MGRPWDDGEPEREHLARRPDDPEWWDKVDSYHAACEARWRERREQFTYDRRRWRDAARILASAAVPAERQDESR
jgi:hypothetical protein